MTLGDAGASIDPISLEVIRRGVIAATNQIDANITRTAFSPFIYEYKDYAVGLLDAQGQLVAQNSGGMPIFVADSVGMAVRAGLEVYEHRARNIATAGCLRLQSIAGQATANPINHEQL